MAARPPHPTLVLTLVLLLGGCSGGAPEPAADAPAGSPMARPDIVEALRADLAAERSPSDGGGRAWIEDGPASIEASDTGTWTLVYEAGPLGVAVGGMVFLQVSPFWGWSTPQTRIPEARGYTTVATTAEGVTLEPETLDQGLLGITVGGRALVAGDRLEIVYGGGEIGAMADRYAESASTFWFAVDGDGDGIRGLVADPPTIAVTAGPAAQLSILGPAVLRPGETASARLAVLDALGNAGVPFEGEILLGCRPLPPPGEQLAAAACGLGLPAAVRLRAEDGGRLAIPLEAVTEGFFVLTARSIDDLGAESGPIAVSATWPRTLWGDLHGHSGLSDGTGTPDDYFGYARDVAALDVVALTDHDHWGLEPLARTPALWRSIRDAVERFHDPRRFVTLLGYEWTSWIYGHRHVLYFEDDGPVLSSIDPAFERPEQLWEGLRGHAALTFAHHSAGGPIATDWTIPPDPELEPVTEIASVHGSSEATDSPGVIYSAVPGNFVRDALGRGYRLGFIGSGDSHDGHPGLADLASPVSGLAGIVSEERTREGVLEALRARRVYATNGARILLDARLGGHPAGSAVTAAALGRAPRLEITMAGAGPLARVELVRSGEITATAELEGRATARWTLPVTGLEAGEALYARVIQRDGGTAWSSPWFVE